MAAVLWSLIIVIVKLLGFKLRTFILSNIMPEEDYCNFVHAWEIVFVWFKVESCTRLRWTLLLEFGMHQSSFLFSGLSDVPGEAMVKLYCPKCMDVYTPKSSRHHHTDGAYFGTGFPHMLFMVHPEYRPKRPANQFVPRYDTGKRFKKKCGTTTAKLLFSKH